jgi:hypothetical protein
MDGGIIMAGQTRSSLAMDHWVRRQVLGEPFSFVRIERACEHVILSCISGYPKILELRTRSTLEISLASSLLLLVKKRSWNLLLGPQITTAGIHP